MKPEFIAKKSMLRALTPMRILFFWLIIPTILMIADMISLSCQTIEFYDGYVVEKKGVFSKQENKKIFPGVYGVSLNQSLLGRIFGYGDLSVDTVGKWDLSLCGVKDPSGLKKHIENSMVAGKDVRSVVME